MRNIENAPADIERVADTPESVKDGKIAALESDLQNEKESRLQERFLWTLALMILVDFIGFPQLGWSFSAVFVFEIVFLLVMARMCAVSGVYTFLQNAIDLATRWQKRGHDESGPPFSSIWDRLSRASRSDSLLQFKVRHHLAAAELVTITDRITACRDPKDDKFLELAVNGRADLIISGDADLLALNPFREIPIVTPAAFVQGVAR
jgi:hypothetical protein